LLNELRFYNLEFILTIAIGPILILENISLLSPNECFPFNSIPLKWFQFLVKYLSSSKMKPLGL
jgi:hypothetical protein